ncbi:MAG: PilZ domain-containing protein [Candidatus Hydrogenedentes bacterium]|nr:PilZ domain-containing protein [Candidatus Hydrogenedentota bacterium]
MTNEDKRGFTRVVTHIEAEVTEDGGSAVACSVDNVSLSGVMIAGGHGMTEGASCSVRLILRGAEPPIAIATKGLILRVRPDRCAIEFREIDGESFEHLRSLVRLNAEDTGHVEDEFDAGFGIKRR